MSLSTKQKILDASIRLFNQNGVANVRLQQIADETGISIGNLAYHYKNKEAIVVSVYETLFEEFAAILSGYLQKPNLEDLDAQISKYFSFFHQYRFYLIDLFEIERNHPELITNWQRCVRKMHLQLRSRIDYFTQKKLMQPEPYHGAYAALTDSLGLTVAFWVSQQVLNGNTVNEAAFKAAVWFQIIPFLTTEGKEAFLQHIQPRLFPSN